MASSDGFAEFVEDQLAGLGEVSAVRMFGGYGLYLGELFFGIVHAGTLYLKTDERTRREYQAHGMGPFRPSARQTLKSYFQVPAEVLDDREQLERWAADAIAVARAGSRRG